MSDVFPKWTNKLPIRVIVGLILLGRNTREWVISPFNPWLFRMPSMQTSLASTAVIVITQWNRPGTAMFLQLRFV